MSKILANEIANYGDDSPIDLKEGLNVPAGKPIQAAGSSGTTGQVLSTTGTTIQWVTPFTGSYTDLTNKPTIPAAQVNADWNASSGLGVILNKPAVPAQPSVTTASAGTAALAYNSANGEFTFTPPDLSSFATETYVTTRGYLTSYTETDPIFSASAASNITTTKISNWDTAFGWGNHSTAGYLIAETDTLQTVIGRGNTSTSPVYFTAKLQYANAFAASDIDSNLATTYDGFFVKNTDDGNAYYSHNTAWKKLLNVDSILDNLADVDLSVSPTNGQVLKWDSGTSRWKAANDLTGGGGGGLSLSDLSVQSSTASGGGSLVYNNGSGVFTYTPPDLSSYITSLGTAILDGDFTTNGLMKRSSAGVYTSTTDNSSNWDTAFGWGNHASGGYLTQLPVHGLGVHTGVTLTSEQAGQLLQYSGTQWVNWTPNYLTSYTETDTLASVTGRGATTSTALTLSAVGEALKLDGNNSRITVNGGNASGEIQVQHQGNARVTLNGTNGITTSSGIGLSLGNYGTNLWRAEIDGTTGNIVTGGSLTAGSMVVGGLTYPTVNGTNGQVLTSDGAGNVAWAASSGGGGASVTISDTPPAASAGDLWWESDTGRLKIYYQDTDTIQWVDVNAPLRQDRIATTGAPSAASDTGVAGDIRYDSGYVYIAVATNTWKRAALTTW